MSVLGVLICLALLAACWVPREPNKALFWGALIGGAVSLIGGAKNRKAQKEANAANSPVGQVAQYEAAGLNPVPFMLGGGYIPQQSASMGDSFAAAGAQFGQALDQNKEQELRETNLELQNDKLRKQLDALAKPSEPSHLQTYGGLVPFPRFGGGNARRGVQALSDLSVVGAADASAPVEASIPTVTHVGYRGDGTRVNPRLVDAEMSETRYGDVMQEVSGWFNLASDNWYNDKLYEFEQTYGKPLADLAHSEYAKADHRSLGEVLSEVSAGKPTSSRPRGRPYRDLSAPVVVPPWGTPEYAEHMRRLYQ